ncbi:hypothetical protein CFE70_001294 [Pyrenophora teres f. teres 0-1]
MAMEMEMAERRVTVVAAGWRSPGMAETRLAFHHGYTETSVSQVQYKALKQPPLHPPGYVFGPVWTALYATMGYTAYRAYTTGTSSANPSTVSLALHGATLYSIQLGLNLLWTPLYFGLGQPIAASVDILALGGTLAYLTSVWGQVDPIGSGYLNNWDFKSTMKKD